MWLPWPWTAWGGRFRLALWRLGFALVRFRATLRRRVRRARLWRFLWFLLGLLLCLLLLHGVRLHLPMRRHLHWPAIRWSVRHHGVYNEGQKIKNHLIAKNIPIPGIGWGIPGSKQHIFSSFVEKIKFYAKDNRKEAFLDSQASCAQDEIHAVRAYEEPFHVGQACQAGEDMAIHMGVGYEMEVDRVGWVEWSWVDLLGAQVLCIE